ncbi:MAG: hypothetical protein ACRCZI_06250 [Cetobacterium sp.]
MDYKKHFVSLTTPTGTKVKYMIVDSMAKLDLAINLRAIMKDTSNWESDFMQNGFWGTVIILEDGIFKTRTQYVFYKKYKGIEL